MYATIVNILKYPGGGLNILDHISFVSSTTRASSYAKISLKKARLNVSSHLFICRTARPWNCLPYVDLSQSVELIKFHIKNLHVLWSNSLQTLTVIMSFCLSMQQMFFTTMSHQLSWFMLDTMYYIILWYLY